MRTFVLVTIALSTFLSQGWAADGPTQSTNIPRFDAAVKRGLAFLRDEVKKSKPDHGYQILAAYAMVKCGVSKEDPFVAEAIHESLHRTSSGAYQPISAYDHIYGSGVDAMLLATVDPDAYKPNLQLIADYVQSVQRPDGSWSDSQTGSGDVSMSQYGILSLWACQRSGCTISPAILDRAADYLLRNGQPDGGWPYRPGTVAGGEGGASSHNMTVAGAGTLGICRLLLHGLRNPPKAEKKDDQLLFGALQKVDTTFEEDKEKFGSAFKDYKPQHSAGSLDERVNRALNWNTTRFAPVGKGGHNLYYFYCLERAAAVGDLGEVNGQDWFVVYGDGLLSLQGPNGGWETYGGPVPGTSFALLYYMRSTDQDIKKMFGVGRQQGKRGNPFGDKEVKREPTELDLLIADMENLDISVDDADIEVADEIVRSVISIDDPEKLVGQADKLKSLMKHPNADVRKSACWALGRTGQFKLVPFMLDGIRDPSVDVNVEAIAALRFISRRPNGFGETLNPLEGVENPTEEQKLKIVNEWRQKAINSWSSWYARVRPHEDQDGFDQLLIAVPLSSKAVEKSKK
jgi:hypothetical protein